MARYRKIINTAKMLIVTAEFRAFLARLEAIDQITTGASYQSIMLLCAHTLADIVPDCRQAHQEEFEVELVRLLRACVSDRREADDDVAVADTPALLH